MRKTVYVLKDVTGHLEDYMDESDLALLKKRGTVLQIPADPSCRTLGEVYRAAAASWNLPDDASRVDAMDQWESVITQNAEKKAF